MGVAGVKDKNENQNSHLVWEDNLLQDPWVLRSNLAWAAGVPDLLNSHRMRKLWL